VAALVRNGRVDDKWVIVVETELGKAARGLVGESFRNWELRTQLASSTSCVKMTGSTGIRSCVACIR